MLENALPDFADVLKILIRTGARYGCEFAKLRHRHVSFEDAAWSGRFSPMKASREAEPAKCDNSTSAIQK